MRTTIIKDVKLLVELRLAYLLDQNTRERLGDLNLLAQNLHEYFEKAIKNGELVAVVAEEQQKICAVAMLSVADRPPRTAADSYRNRGMATAVMETLLEKAEKLELASVELLASEEGKYLYEKQGFHCPIHTYMRKNL